jgi:hypothetical protein
MSNEKAPSETPISDGAKLTAAEAAMIAHTHIIRHDAAELNRRFRDDVPQLPYRVPEIR